MRSLDRNQHVYRKSAEKEKEETPPGQPLSQKQQAKEKEEEREEKLKAGDQENTQKKRTKRAKKGEQAFPSKLPPIERGHRGEKDIEGCEVMDRRKVKIGVGVRHMSHQKGYKAQDTRLH